MPLLKGRALMADKLDVQVTGKSEAEIAYQLFQTIAAAERTSLYPADDGRKVADRDYIIKTFSACMLAVKQPGYYL